MDLNDILSALACASRLLTKPGFRKALPAARSPKEVLDLLSERSEP